jgi:hypothetical protein
VAFIIWICSVVVLPVVQRTVRVGYGPAEMSDRVQVGHCHLSSNLFSSPTCQRNHEKEENALNVVY